jgi:hypothetical protein
MFLALESVITFAHIYQQNSSTRVITLDVRQLPYTPSDGTCKSKCMLSVLLHPLIACSVELMTDLRSPSIRTAGTKSRRESRAVLSPKCASLVTRDIRNPLRRRSTNYAGAIGGVSHNSITNLRKTRRSRFSGAGRHEYLS